MVESLNPALRPFWKQRSRNRVLYGGRASSKSWDAAGMLVYLANNYSIRALCARQFLNKSGDSIYTLLKNQIYRFGLHNDFDIQATRIICKETGSELFFLGLWRNIDEIKSLEDVDICLLEEAHNLTEEQWHILDGTFRKKGFQFWIVFNPKLRTDFVYRRFIINPPPSTISRKINYLENPWLDEEYIENVINAMKEEDYEEYCHQFLGEPKENDEASIIKRSHIIASIDAHKKLNIEPRGSKRLGFDVADSGEDACAYVAAYGSLNYDADLWKAKEDELLKSCTRVWHKAREHEAEITYDAIGVGASSGAKFNELNEQIKRPARPIVHNKYFAGGSPIKPNAKYGNTNIKNKDFFCNIKSQSWWILGDRFRNTYNAIMNGQQFSEDEMIFIDSNMPHLEKLIDELCTPQKDFDLAGRVKVESKKDLAKRDITSPNLADAFVMANQIHIKSGNLF